MNKFAKTMSHTSYKLKQKAGMAERTVDQSFEESKVMLNEMIENATNICKTFIRHAESLEGLSPPKQLTEPYKLTLEQSTDINLDMQELFRLTSIIVNDFGDNKKEVFQSFQKYLGELQAVKEKARKCDDLLVDYDKHKDELASLTSKNSKEEDKVNKEKLKTQQYKEMFDTQSKEVIETVQQLHASQQQNLAPSFHLMIASQLNFFERMSTAYHSNSALVM